MLVIPLQTLPNQTIEVQLANQDCTINVYQRAYGLFLDLSVAGVSIVAGAVCENLNKIVRYAYLGFIGDLAFLDTQGSNDPGYTGLGANGRFQLMYLDASEV